VVASIGLIEAPPQVFHVVGRPTRTGPTWVWTRDDLDLATVSAARAELAALFAGDTTPRYVLLYLGVERFVDVRGLRLLVEAARWARHGGGDLAVVAPPRCLRRMVARLDLRDDLFLATDARHALRWVRR
jgi:anti-anti-sigma factor